MAAGTPSGMGKLLGTSFVASQGDVGRYTVELARFGVAGPLDGVDAISLVVGALEVAVRASNLGPVSVGKIISNSAQSEAGLFVDLSATEGAAISLSCPRLTSEVTVAVARSSKALRGAMWTVLGVAVVAGVLAARALLPNLDPQLGLAVGLFGGVAVAVAVLAMLSRSQLLAAGRSADIAARVDVVVRAWVDADPAAAKRTKRRKKKRKAATGDPSP